MGGLWWLRDNDGAEVVHRYTSYGVRAAAQDAALVVCGRSVFAEAVPRWHVGDLPIGCGRLYLSPSVRDLLARCAAVSIALDRFVDSEIEWDTTTWRDPAVGRLRAARGIRRPMGRRCLGHTWPLSPPSTIAEVRAGFGLLRWTHEHAAGSAFLEWS